MQTTNFIDKMTPTKVSPGKAQQEFAQSLKGAIEKLNEAQVVSDKKTQALAKGEITDLDDVMIAAQKASITLQTAVEVQRKAIDAYNEIMRMQV
ncbi:flagellar hook-basal body complex protein FliE [Aquibacillus sp. 3ASR75-11]|uniref:Flagellar hook-basal body complex protein FliE n=1 Tax=Terrihalobacillus insolitus TaxID=2950438 RepID=A0A9X3WP65_9BACI|nr:flagellar hook-basal body complex protein FliE [Terrihalobacillus insolitus]MDC3414140.1 flagellar hook-basal body complex protein FliE [Terrihalobacillus insolitus]MDC3423582.1 flagellar hook-basal body complex protein FliE [Terrihalobacillus insolitus]